MFLALINIYCRIFLLFIAYNTTARRLCGPYYYFLLCVTAVYQLPGVLYLKFFCFIVLVLLPTLPYRSSG